MVDKISQGYLPPLVTMGGNGIGFPADGDWSSYFEDEERGAYGLIYVFDSTQTKGYRTIKVASATDVTNLGTNGGNTPYDQTIISVNGNWISKQAILAYRWGNTNHSSWQGFLMSAQALVWIEDIPEGISFSGNNVLQNMRSCRRVPRLSSTVTRIPAYFFDGSGITFDFEIPSTVTYINGSIFEYISDFAGTITINSTAPINSPSANTLASARGNAQYGISYTQGIKLTGAGAQIWKDAFPDSNSSPYRKLIVV